MSTPPPEDCREQVRRVLEQEVERIDSPEAAEAVIRQVEQLAKGETEQQVAQQVAQAPTSAVEHLEQAKQAAPTAATQEVAQVLAATAAETVAPTAEAPAVMEAAREVLGPRPATVPPEARRGRELLKDAVLHQMGPLQALDARIYLLVNGLPHPRWSDRLADAITTIATGGWIWAGGVLLAGRLGVPGTRRALVLLMPSMMGATAIVEHPVKAVFRRRRPFVDIVRALVVGKRPGSWSFPSGHTASSFACAWLLSTIWPRRSPIFFALASVVGFSRTYVGAHYPGDVTAGACAGMLLSELIRRGTCRVLQAQRD